MAADVVIDTSGYTPDSVAATARLVAPSVEKYVFMSSVDAYDLSAASIDESSPTKTLPEGATTAEPQAEFYGARLQRHEKVLVLVGSAGRDPARWDDPARFAIRRRLTADLGQ